ncbi:MAG: putative rane protein [Clostridium butyricum]|nr:putative rane protein [Clostridium butyricum]
MKKIWNIYKTDIKNIVTNYAAFITIAALCILPSLYAWFNIAASWDPYAKEATSQIKIGVINNDDGAEVEGKEIFIICCNNDLYSLSIKLRRLSFSDLSILFI